MLGVLLIGGLLGLFAYEALREHPSDTVLPDLPDAAPTPAPDAAKAPAKASPKVEIIVTPARVAPTSQPKAPTPAEPIYPIGLEAKLGGRQARIVKSWVDAQGVVQYAVDLKLGLLFGAGDGVHTVSEAKLRETMASETKQSLALDQAFPAGVQIFRNGQGGVIDSVVKQDGMWVYQIHGWPTSTPQAQLLQILGR